MYFSQEVGTSGMQQDYAYYIYSKQLLGPLEGDRKILNIKYLKSGTWIQFYSAQLLLLNLGPKS